MVARQQLLKYVALENTNVPSVLGLSPLVPGHTVRYPTVGYLLKYAQ